MTRPTIHLNGTSLGQLIEDNERASSAIRDAIEVMSETGPNARDYYPQGDAAIAAAIAEHRARLDKLREVLTELEAIGEYLGEEELIRGKR